MNRRQQYDRSRRRRYRERQVSEKANASNQKSSNQSGDSEGNGNGSIIVNPNAIADRALDVAIGVVVGQAVSSLVFGRNEG